MPFPFSTFTSLLQKLEDVETRNPPLLPGDKTKVLKYETEAWFRKHRRQIDGLDIDGAVALLSSLLPERRTDRVYGIQAPRLCRMLGRALRLGAVPLNQLLEHKQPGRGDLGQCLERVLKAGGPPARPQVLLIEVDEMLLELAGQCRFSDGSVKAKLPAGSSEERDKLIGNLIKRMDGLEGKWLVRLILKEFAPVRVNENLVLKLFHFLLPDLLRFQNNFEVAVHLLKEQRPFRELPEQPDPRSEQLFKRDAASALRPLIGVKVGRPNFVKARSIDHCMKMLGSDRWVVERKYDGEYCEIHIDLRQSSKHHECIQIFSKSGKDSTADRVGIHQTLVDCLRLGKPDCKIKEQAIVLGELVVYSDQTKCVLGFDKIRKHVSRSGVFLGNEQDSQPHAHEHLAIVLFDLLLLDEEVVMTRPVDERRNWLREMYRKIPGRAMSAEWKTIDFADARPARGRLMEQFAASITQRCEGLILKPCGIPYFPLDCDTSGRTRSYIKLKKDYIASMGDEADFAVVGASYNAQQALRSGVPGIKWTDFHLGSLVNAADVQRFDAKPVFKIVATIQQEACIPKPILSALNSLGTHLAQPYSGETDSAPFKMQLSMQAKVDVLFRTPFVLEVLGSGFDKPSNCSFYMLRHARATKLHQDRSWKDCISFQALQEQADAARHAPADSELDETRCWIQKIQQKMKSRLQREGTLTPKSRRTKTPSTAKNTETSGSSALDGTTLVEKSPPPKRACADGSGTPCPQAKRQRLTATKEVRRESVSASTPLSDITNQIAQRDNIQPTKQLRPDKATLLRSSGRLLAPDAKVQACSGTRCPFNDATVYFAPCVANTPYLTEDLLPTHNAELTQHMSHWDRDSFAHAPMAETVSESQSHPGLRKIVIAEVRRPQAVNRLLEQVVALNGGHLQERIEVYDWRALEQCAQHDQGPELLKRHFIGATIWDDLKRRAVFVSTIPGISCQ